MCDCSSNAGTTMLPTESAMTMDDQRTSRRRSESMYTAVGGVPLACPPHPHSQPSERGAPEPRTLLLPGELHTFHGALAQHSSKSDYSVSEKLSSTHIHTRHTHSHRDWKRMTA